MRWFSSKALILILSVLLIPCAGLAQKDSAAAISPSTMFHGETLVYEGKLNKILRGISVAELTFSAAADAQSKQLVVNAEAVSKGTLLKLFRFSFLQQYASTVDPLSFRITRSVKHDVQKQRVRDSEALFDYEEKRVTFTETDPVELTRPPRRIASEIGDQMYDMITAIYAVRLEPLKIGKKLEFAVSDSGLVYQVPVSVTGREMQKTVLGRKWCYRVEPQIFGDNRMIEQKGRMVIWFTDDPRRIPVRAKIHTSYGTIDVKLKSAIHPNGS